MLESNPIPTTTIAGGFTNINTPATSNTIGSIFTPEQVACVCEVLQQSNDIQRLGTLKKTRSQKDDLLLLFFS
jgi:3-dehydroquinate synthetase